MTRENAQQAVTTSAVIVAIVYAYRYLIEGPGQSATHLATPQAGKQLAGQGGPPPLEHFLVGYGFAFVLISLMAQADPDLGGGFAVLVLVATLLAQGQQIAADINSQLVSTVVASAGKAAQAPQQAAGLVATLPGGQNPISNAGNAVGGALGSDGFDPGFYISGVGQSALNVVGGPPLASRPPANNPVAGVGRQTRFGAGSLFPGFLK